MPRTSLSDSLQLNSSLGILELSKGWCSSPAPTKGSQIDFRILRPQSIFSAPYVASKRSSELIHWPKGTRYNLSSLLSDKKNGHVKPLGSGNSVLANNKSHFPEKVGQVRVGDIAALRGGQLPRGALRLHLTTNGTSGYNPLAGRRPPGGTSVLPVSESMASRLFGMTTQ